MSKELEVASRCPQWWMERLDNVTMGEWHELCVELGIRRAGSEFRDYSHALSDRMRWEERSRLMAAWAFRFADMLLAEDARRQALQETDSDT